MRFAVLAAAAATAASGCATTPSAAESAAVQSIAETRTLIGDGRRQVAVTVGALDRLVRSAGGDLAGAFRSFSENIADTERLADRVAVQAKALRERGPSILETWEEEGSGPADSDGTQPGLPHRADAAAEYEHLTQAMEAAAAALDPFLKDLLDVQRHLSMDLTEDGIRSAEDMMSEARDSARQVQQNLGAAVAGIDRVASKLSPNRP